MTGLFVAIGHDPRNELVKGVVELADDGGYVVAEGRSTRTNVAGVFACGDLVDQPTDRRSRRPGPGAPPRWMPSTSSPRSGQPIPA